MINDRISVVDDRGDAHIYAIDVHRALVAVGLIWLAGNVWRMRTGSIDLGEFPELATCDFCSAQPVTWAIDADEFVIRAATGQMMRSTSGWLACEACGAAVQAGNRSALDARALAMVLRDLPARVPRGPFIAEQRIFLAQFWRHYRGISRYATPYTPEDPR